MASTINFSCEKCRENFSIILGSFAYKERTRDDDMESVNAFNESLSLHQTDKNCDGKVVFKGFGNID